MVEAAIEAGCHYVDLADSRTFVEDIARFDRSAREAGAVVVTGASTTPALTHAVAGELTRGWLDVDSIDVAIVPGNRTPKGRSVIEAVLGWVGHPLRWYNEGQWQNARGWGASRRLNVPPLGPRRVALADVPDLVMLPRRFKPRVRAGFFAGMDLALLQSLIGLAGWAVRARLVSSARAFRGFGWAVATMLGPFGSDAGGMVVEAAGRDARGEAHRVLWSLVARSGEGPFVPAIAAAAVISAIAEGRGPVPGAHVAAEVVSLDDLLPWVEGLRIETRREDHHAEVPLFRRVLGEAFDKMPLPTRRLHRGRPAIVAEGEADVTAAKGAALFLARMFGLPTENGLLPLRVVIETRGEREYWVRFFEGRPMRSLMRQAGPGRIEERFGPVAVRMRLEGHVEGLDMVVESGRMWGVPLPRALLPRVKASERVEQGRHRFDVDIRLPLLGRLVSYRGWLRV